MYPMKGTVHFSALERRKLAGGLATNRNSIRVFLAWTLACSFVHAYEKGELITIDNGNTFAIIDQVVDARNMIATIKEPSTPSGMQAVMVGGRVEVRPAPQLETLVWIEATTEGLVDHQPHPSASFEVIGTKQYNSVAGIKTVPLLRRLSKDDLAARIKEREAAAEALLYRTWTDSDGKFTIRAKFLKFSDSKIYLQKEDADKIEVPMRRLSKADQEWVRSELKKRAEQRKSAKKR